MSHYPTDERDADVVVLGVDYPDSFAEAICAALGELSVSARLVDPTARYATPGTLSAFSGIPRYLGEATRRSALARRVLVDQPVEQILDGLDPKLVISTRGQFEPDQVKRWRRKTPNAVWVLWYPDSLANLGAHTALLAPYDRLFFKDPYLVDKLTSMTSLSVDFLPEACLPSRHRTEKFLHSDEEERFTCDVMVAGNMYAYRALVLQNLPPSIELKLYGNFPRRSRVTDPSLREAFTGMYLVGRQKALAFRGAKIALNTMHYAEIQSANQRLFEATACGAFVLTQRFSALEQYYSEGSEVVAFESGAELRAAVEHYLEMQDEREAIARAGQQRAHGQHTYAQRFDVMFSACGLSSLLAERRAGG